MSAQHVRITTAGKVHNYVEYVLSVLDPAREHEALARACGCGIVQLEAEGHAVNKAVTVAEIVKRRLDGLHQVTTAALQADNASSLHTDQQEQQLRPRQNTVPTICITLSSGALESKLSNGT